jgi:hypothetical protein
MDLHDPQVSTRIVVILYFLMFISSFKGSLIVLWIIYHHYHQWVDTFIVVSLVMKQLLLSHPMQVEPRGTLPVREIKTID